MRCFSLIAITFLFASLSASVSFAEETRTVDWYKSPENSAALEAKLAECKNNPGELADTPNCKNARAASQALFKSGSFEKVQEPEYGFGTSKSQ